MQDGFIKVAVATPEIRVADCVFNTAAAVGMARRAAQCGARLLVLPELCLTGYTCGDLFLRETLIEGARAALASLCAQTRALPVLIVAGLPVVSGAKLYNCAAVVYQGRVLGIVPKTHLPNYGEFYERRWFVPAPDGSCGFVRGYGEGEVPFGRMLFRCEELGEFCFAVELCEDLWAPVAPSAAYAAAGAAVIANLSASVETVGKDDYRRALVTGQSGRLVCGYLYANAGEGESTTDLVFSGHSMIAENGSMLAQTGRFEQTMAVSEIDVQRLAFERRRLTTFPAGDAQSFLTIPFSMPLTETKLTRPVPALPFVPPKGPGRDQCCAGILQVQAHGLKKRIDHTGAKTAVVGISGGLDSALALLVCVRAMELLGRPRTDVHAVTMPCFGTTARTRGNAQIICERLGVTFSCVDITASVRRHFADIGHDEAVRDVTFENAQARERTQVLMDIANETGGLVVGTGDLSELALGWATYNGDQMSMYGVNASVPKTLVRHLVAYEAERACDDALRAALCDILDTPVSPELLPPDDGAIAQKTEDLVGPYELHDFFLYHVLRWGFSPHKTLRLALYAFGQAYPRETILYWMRTFYRRFFAQQFKRSCMPDGPKIGSVSLSPRGDWRMPSDASAALWLSEVEKL